MKNYEREFKFSVIWGVVASFYGVFSLASASSLASSTLSPPIGEITKLEGKAWVKHLGSTKSESLKVKGSLYSDDTLLSESDSQITLMLGKKQIALLVKPNSQLQIQKQGEQNWGVDLKTGGVVSVVRPDPKNLPDFYKFKARGSTMGVRGTGFFTQALPGKDLFVCTCVGEVSFDGNYAIKSKHHDSPKWIKPGNQPIRERMSPGEQGSDHSDADGLELSKLLE